MDTTQKIINSLLYVINLPLIPVGKTMVTIWMLFYIAGLLWIMVATISLLQRRLLTPILAKSSFDANAQNIVALSARYFAIAIGAVIILNTAGIEMTALTVVAGAVGLGLSLGLQNVAKNFIGGLVIFLERPIKIGDRIQIGDTVGDVIRIALRATTIRSSDHTDIIVPNADFISNKITNWNSSNSSARISIPISLSIENDPESIQKLLCEVAASHENVLAEPPPETLLDSFGEKSINFILRVSSNDFSKIPNGIRSDLNLLICKRLQKENISIGW